MNPRIVKGVVAGAGAVLLAAAGRVTASAPVGSADVGPERPHGRPAAARPQRRGGLRPGRFGGLLPGGESRRLVWVAREDAASSMPGTLSVSFRPWSTAPRPATRASTKHGRRSTPASRVHDHGLGPRGIPARGNLSRVLAVDVAYAGAAEDGCGAAAMRRRRSVRGCGRATCATPPGTSDLSGPGCRRPDAAFPGRGRLPRRRRPAGRQERRQAGCPTTRYRGTPCSSGYVSRWSRRDDA